MVSLECLVSSGEIKELPRGQTESLLARLSRGSQKGQSDTCVEGISFPTGDNADECPVPPEDRGPEDGRQADRQEEPELRREEDLHLRAGQQRGRWLNTERAPKRTPVTSQ